MEQWKLSPKATGNGLRPNGVFGSWFVLAQTKRIYKDVALPAFDTLVRIKATDMSTPHQIDCWDNLYSSFQSITWPFLCHFQNTL